MSELKLPSLEEMLGAGMHFGHRSFRWHPRMAPFIFGEREGVHIINLELTQEYLKQALNFVESVGRGGGKILFVGTKKQVAPIIKRYAEEAGVPYVVSRWPGGLLTNFRTVLKSLKRIRKLEELLQNPFATKKEKRSWQKQKEDLEANFAGIAELTDLPAALYVVDLVKEKNAAREAHKLGLPIVGVVDTNADPALARYPIPANDDATSSVEMITALVAQAFRRGQKRAQAAAAQLERTPTDKTPVDGAGVGAELPVEAEEIAEAEEREVETVKLQAKKARAAKS